MSDNWGPSYGDPTHPTTGELPRVGDGRGTDELRTVQVDTVPEAPPQRPSRHRYSWETSAPRESSHADPSGSWSMQREPDHAEPGNAWSAPRESNRPESGHAEPGNPWSAPREPNGSWSVPRVGREGASFTGPQPQVRSDDTTQFARVGDGLRGSVGPVTVQVDHVRLNGGTSGDTQLLPTASFMRPSPEPIPEAVESPQPEPGTGSMPAMRHQIGPDWTQTPLRLLAAAAVATAVLGASAATLISIGNWINP
ncbi:hypothetical protein [Glycomyces paridis]|uniref:Uncharacterized protein n=1 Tax=Glycomyces paridis TaxID=2126555 RepID=A0A4S8PK76_9ACTN|nr:hypothetical protein [Glycomyces paridis]THV28664.1 hypothetical protein E9998_11145 [Glycomyces paridis]